ncbi:1-Phosphatidylinositol 4,5-Bisphosphate Phosphodiesterase Gamma-1 [Manis pentadactyla]|nr:1-Phosphatidylinositol 4,5-Bisphosphate Phosphodiesterase Gamma-1 [Manis pentadactyla]
MHRAALPPPESASHSDREDGCVSTVGSSADMPSSGRSLEHRDRVMKRWKPAGKAHSSSAEATIRHCRGEEMPGVLN